MPAQLDWREMFRKYAEVVGRNEGVLFLEAQDWTDEEWSAIVEMFPELKLKGRYGQNL